MGDDVRVRMLLREAAYAEQWARQLRDQQQFHLDKAEQVGQQAADAETRAAGLRAQAAAFQGGPRVES